MAYTNIDNGTAYFHTQLYTGTGSNQVITNDADSGDFQPDWVVVKNRNNGSYGPVWFDSTRGVYRVLYSDDAYGSDNEGVDSGASTIQSFNTNGFTGGSSTNPFVTNWLNSSGESYVAWQIKNNAGSTSSNTDGSITSTVQVNTTAGISFGTFTGTGSTATVGHGLGAKPDMLLLKSRNNPSGAAMYWMVAHKGIDGMAGTKNLFLNKDWVADTSSVVWGNTAPTSSVFTVGTNAAVNYSGNNMLFYAFTSVQGFSKFGKYVGNGSTTNGPFVYTGFKPAFVMIKAVDAVKNWTVFDNKRYGYNGGMRYLYMNMRSAEGDSPSSNAHIDLLSNGFKIYDNWTLTNQSGVNYCYMAFAEKPFVTSTGIPTTAR